MAASPNSNERISWPKRAVVTAVSYTHLTLPTIA